jgi:hypothetical protein
MPHPEVDTSADAAPPGVAASYDTITTTVHNCGSGLQSLRAECEHIGVAERETPCGREIQTLNAKVQI